MARGRLISRTLGSSRKFAALQGVAGKLTEFCQVLFPLLVSHADDFGRMSGDAFTVKLVVFPSSPRKEPDFADALEAMARVGLILLYPSDDNGEQVLQIVKFDEHQPGLSKRTKSKFPAFSGTPVNFTEIPSELNRTELKGTEPNGTVRREAFEQFWEACPKKAGKGEAWKEWQQIKPSPEQAAVITAAMVTQRDNPRWREENMRFCPHPSKWLKQGRWDDEPVVRGPTKSKLTQRIEDMEREEEAYGARGLAEIQTGVQPAHRSLPAARGHG